MNMYMFPFLDCTVNKPHKCVYVFTMVYSEFKNSMNMSIGCIVVGVVYYYLLFCVLLDLVHCINWFMCTMVMFMGLLGYLLTILEIITSHVENSPFLLLLTMSYWLGWRIRHDNIPLFIVGFHPFLHYLVWYYIV